MRINQIYDVVNELYAQSTGKEALASVDATALISIGDEVLSNEATTDAFVDALVDRIGRTVLQNRSYTPETLDLIMDSTEFGAVIQKIYTAPVKSSMNNSWELAEGSDMSTVTMKKPTSIQKLFSVKNVYEFEITIPMNQMKSAFTDGSSMAAWIDSIYTVIDNSLNISLEDMSKLCINNFIMNKIEQYTKSPDVKQNHCINLNQAYKDATGITLTEEEALVDVEFLKFGNMIMNQKLGQMGTYGSLFNLEGYERFTPKSEAHVFIHNEWAQASRFFLQSDIYNKELVALPKYKEVMYWQGTGTTYDREETTAIQMEYKTIDGDEQMLTPVKYVMGVIIDKDAVGVMQQHKANYKEFYPKVEAYQFWNKNEQGYFNDFSENGIAFILGPVA